MLEKYNGNKITSLLIKTVIFVFSIYYIIQKVKEYSFDSNSFDIKELVKSNYFILTFSLMFLNWGIEAIKWKYLIRKVETISIATAFKSVLLGVSISIFAPNRAGEFIGKVGFLKTKHKFKATIISIVGSGFQLLVTVIAGVLAIIFCYNSKTLNFEISQIVEINNLLLWLLLLLSVGTILVLWFKNNLRWKQIVAELKVYSTVDLIIIFLLSIIRYCVFSLQFYLILMLFNVDVGAIYSLILISLTFFVSTVVPTFALTEIVVRSATAVFFFSKLSNDTDAVILSSVLLWLINLAFPAILGTFFIWQLKLFKAE